ncbi:MAG: cysteine hydrolase [Chloroflexi bacterium]|nr:cysteine hydrolase [Chloroflexota bacterium]
MPALVIIDVQRGLCRDAAAADPIDAVIGRINLLVARARAAAVPLIVVQHHEPDGPLRAGSDDWQPDPRLTPLPDALLVPKHTPDSFHGTALGAILTRLGSAELVLCGLQTEYCVDTTARRALALGYGVTLVGDAHATADNGILTAAQIVAHHTLTLSRIDSFARRVTVCAAAAWRPAR